MSFPVEEVNQASIGWRLKEIGVTVVAPERRSQEYLKKFVENEIEKWAVPIKASGVSMELKNGLAVLGGQKFLTPDR